MRKLASAGVVAGAALLLAACGGGGSSADAFAEMPVGEILTSARAAMDGLESVHLSGTATQQGQQVTMDVGLTRDGSCKGTIELGTGSADLVRAENKVWIRPDAEFWKSAAAGQAEAIMKVVGDRWVAVGGDSGDFGELCDLDSLLDEIDGDDAAEKVKKAGTEEVDGTTAVKITKADDGGTAAMFIAAEGKHYILKLENDTDDAVSATFSAFDEPVEIEAPAAEDVVDLDNLG